jgi:hypothetical protein
VTLRRTSQMLRPALALFVLAAILSVIAPFASVSARNLCTLTCCAGRAPHAVGSCMDGTCYVALRNRKKTVIRNLHPERPERLCGAKSVVAKRRATSPWSASTGASQSSKAEAATLSKPCSPECASCSGFASSNSLSKSAALSSFDRSRPPPVLQSTADNAATALSESLYYGHSQRGPPVFKHA